MQGRKGLLRQGRNKKRSNNKKDSLVRHNSSLSTAIVEVNWFFADEPKIGDGFRDNGQVSRANA